MKIDVKDELKARVQQVQYDQDQAPEVDHDFQDQPPLTKKTPLNKLLGPEEELESCMEVDTYLSVKPISRLTNPLDWWKENNARFPYLAQLAKTSLCIPATFTLDLPKGCSQRLG